MNMANKLSLLWKYDTGGGDDFPVSHTAKYLWWEHGERQVILLNIIEKVFQIQNN